MGVCVVIGVRGGVSAGACGVPTGAGGMSTGTGGITTRVGGATTGVGGVTITGVTVIVAVAVLEVPLVLVAR